MNSIFSMSILVILFSFTVYGSEQAEITSLSSEQLFFRQLPDLKNLDWKVGEYQKRDLYKGGFRGGRLLSWVDREEGKAVWILSELKVIFKKKKIIEILVERKKGKILKYIVDGKEQDPPSIAEMDDCEVLEEAKVKIKVPAGQYVTDRTIARCDKDVFAIYETDKVNMGGFVKLSVLTKDKDPSKPKYIVNLVEFGQK